MRVILDDGWVELSTGELLRQGQQARLTGKELAVLRYLIRHAGSAVTLAELHTEVWEHAPHVVSRAAYHTIGRRMRICSKNGISQIPLGRSSWSRSPVRFAGG